MRLGGLAQAIGHYRDRVCRRSGDPQRHHRDEDFLDRAEAVATRVGPIDVDGVAELFLYPIRVPIFTDVGVLTHPYRRKELNISGTSDSLNRSRLPS